MTSRLALPSHPGGGFLSNTQPLSASRQPPASDGRAGLHGSRWHRLDPTRTRCVRPLNVRRPPKGL